MLHPKKNREQRITRKRKSNQNMGKWEGTS